MTRRKNRIEPEPAGSFAFTYADYEDWYSDVRASLLDPALATFRRILNEALDRELNEIDRLRIRVSSARVKSPARLWRKMLKDDYVGGISELDDILNVIDDLVGVRVTCNNLSDVEYLQEILAGLPDADDDVEMPTGLCIEPSSERNYNDEPKKSGYRAYHINLRTLIPSIAEWKHARGELQVRTLLQDSWGELTHEDTYKPDSAVPDLVTNLARRMADLLATVDDLAQDLRNELDQLSGTGVDRPSVEGDGATPKSMQTEQEPDGAASIANLEQAVSAEIRRMVGSLRRPIALAALASQLQASFGTEIAHSWLGHGSFKALLKKIVPDVAIVGEGPGFVVPSGLGEVPVDEHLPIDSEEEIPSVLRRLRGHDKTLPLVSPAKLVEFLETIEQVLGREAWDAMGIDRGYVGIRELNVMSKRARQIASDSDRTLGRQALDYLLKALLFSGNLRPDLSRAEIAAILAAWLFARATSLGLVLDADNDRSAIGEWLAVDQL